MKAERVKLYRVGERANIKAELVALSSKHNIGEQVVSLSLFIRPKSKAPAWLDERMKDKSPLTLCVYFAGKPFTRGGYQIEQLDWELGVLKPPIVTARLVRPIASAIDARYFNKDGSIGGGYEAGLAPGLKYPVHRCNDARKTLDPRIAKV